MSILYLPKEIYKTISVPTLEQVDLYEKKVLLRADLDVPLSKGEIADNSRLIAALPTIEYLLGKKCEIIICGHLGRPSGKDNKYTLEPVYKWFKKRFLIEDKIDQLIKVGDFEGWQIGKKIQLLENLRFYKEEEGNDSEFAKKLASLADIYVNDAFASSHRAHASIVGVSKHVPHYPGLRLEAEVAEITLVMEVDKRNQKFKGRYKGRPLTIIIGGAKIETKLPLVEKMHKFADYVLVGGEIAEKDKVLAKVAHEKLNPSAGGKKSVLLVADLTGDNKDITENSTQNFIQIINISKTIVWNGPMGMFEEGFDRGTRELAKAIINSNAHTVVGGGNTVEFLKKEGLLDKFSFVSMGGGAMLEFLAGDKLPGLLALGS